MTELEKQQVWRESRDSVREARTIHDLWTIVHPDGEPLYPFFCKEHGELDRGMCVYTSKRNAEIAVLLHNMVWGTNCRVMRLDEALEGKR